jgi:hypothetical protein
VGGVDAPGAVVGAAAATVVGVVAGGTVVSCAGRVAAIGAVGMVRAPAPEPEIVVDVLPSTAGGALVGAPATVVGAPATVVGVWPGTVVVVVGIGVPHGSSAWTGRKRSSAV